MTKILSKASGLWPHLDHIQSVLLYVQSWRESSAALLSFFMMMRLDEKEEEEGPAIIFIILRVLLFFILVSQMFKKVSTPGADWNISCWWKACSHHHASLWDWCPLAFEMLLELNSKTAYVHKDHLIWCSFFRQVFSTNWNQSWFFSNYETRTTTTIR